MPRMVNVHAAKTQLSRLLKRVARGEEIILSRNGKPIARLIGLVTKDGSLPEDDPLLKLDKFGFDGPRGVLTTGRSTGLFMACEALVDSSVNFFEKHPDQGYSFTDSPRSVAPCFGAGCPLKPQRLIRRFVLPSTELK